MAKKPRKGAHARAGVGVDEVKAKLPIKGVPVEAEAEGLNVAADIGGDFKEGPDGKKHLERAGVKAGVKADHVKAKLPIKGIPVDAEVKGLKVGLDVSGGEEKEGKDWLDSNMETVEKAEDTPKVLEADEKPALGPGAEIENAVERGNKVAQAAMESKRQERIAMAESKFGSMQAGSTLENSMEMGD